jgi:hypothetical protein
LPENNLTCRHTYTEVYCIFEFDSSSGNEYLGRKTINWAEMGEKR